MAKVCNSAFVDQKYGSDKFGELNNPDRKFATINTAIDEINKNRDIRSCNRWVVFLSPCIFEEDIKLYPFIDLHGLDRTASIIKGTISASKLEDSKDQVELKELTIVGQIVKSNKSLGLLSLFEINIFTPTTCSPIDIEAGQVKMDSCVINQIICSKTKSACDFYYLHGSHFIDLNVRNCRHERIMTKKTSRGQIFSNITTSNTNNKTLISFQSNLFFNRFEKYFNGLLIPYNTDKAAGFLQSHSDTLRHDFKNGAGTGVKPPVEGETYDNAFILTRKIKAPEKDLEVHIHTTEILNLPEKTLNTFSSVHTITSGKAKTKHTGWQGFREIPEALRIQDNATPLTVVRPNAERSMIGAASDNKLFASRLVLETLTIANIPPDGNLQGPSVIIPDNVGFVNVEQAPIILLIPFGPNLTLGQQITFSFGIQGPVLIGTTPDPNNPPSPGTFGILSDSNIPGTWSSIVYNLLPIKPPPSIYPPNSIGAVEGISSVTFTLIAIGGTQGGNISYLWKAISTTSRYSVFLPGTTNISVPPGSTSINIAAWAGGGAGGKSDSKFVVGEGASAAGGGGGGSGGAFTLIQNISGISSISLNIGTGSKVAGQDGNNTEVTIGNFLIIAQGGKAGGNGSIDSNTPANGGLGGNVLFFSGQQPISPLDGATIYNGVQGGQAGPNNNATSKGNPGFTSATGYPGGDGGALDSDILSTPFISGPGGGGGGFNGKGATAGSFFLTGFGIWAITNSGNPADISGGGGGAGEGPRSISLIANGGDGGAIIFFT